jgi:hypothetical protein
LAAVLVVEVAATAAVAARKAETKAHASGWVRNLLGNRPPPPTSALKIQCGQRQVGRDAAGRGAALVFVGLGAHRGERPPGRESHVTRAAKFPATPRLPTSATQSPRDSCSGGHLSSVKDLWLLHAPSPKPPHLDSTGLNWHSKSSITASTSPRKEQLRLQPKQGRGPN